MLYKYNTICNLAHTIIISGNDALLLIVFNFLGDKISGEKYEKFMLLSKAHVENNRELQCTFNEVGLRFIFI